MTEEREIPDFRGLKILVIVMGVMIIIGVIILGIALVKRYGDKHVISTATHHQAAKVKNGTISVPKGMRAKNLSQNGDLLAILLEDSAGNQSILLYNQADESQSILRLIQ